MLKKLIVLACAVVLSSCAGISAVPSTAGDQKEGVFIPDVKPLLVVGSTASVLLVPNPNKGTRLKFWAFLAKHDLTASFSQGTLSSLTSNQDTTALPVALLQALSTTAAAAKTSLGSAFEGSASSGKLQVFDMVFNDKGDLVGLTPLIKGADLLDVPSGIAAPVGDNAPPAAADQKAAGAGGDAAATPVPGQDKKPAPKKK